MHIHLNQGVIRGYASGKSFESRDPFIYSMNFMLLNSETVFISSLISKQKIDTLSEIKNYLVDMGVRQVIADLPTKYMPEGFELLSDTGLYSCKIGEA